MHEVTLIHIAHSTHQCLYEFISMRSLFCLLIAFPLVNWTTARLVCVHFNSYAPHLAGSVTLSERLVCLIYHVHLLRCICQALVCGKLCFTACVHVLISYLANFSVSFYRHDAIFMHIAHTPYVLIDHGIGLNHLTQSTPNIINKYHNLWWWFSLISNCNGFHVNKCHCNFMGYQPICGPHEYFARQHHYIDQYSNSNNDFSK